MKLYRIISLLLIIIWADTNAQEKNNDHFPYGLWQITSKIPVDKNDTIIYGSLTQIFYFHPDTTITFRLFHLPSSSMGDSITHFRLKARWKDNFLHVLFLNNKWEKMFYWKTDHFEYVDGNALNIYSYIKPEKINNETKIFLLKRKVSIPN